MFDPDDLIKIKGGSGKRLLIYLTSVTVRGGVWLNAINPYQLYFYKKLHKLKKLLNKKIIFFGIMLEI